MLFSWQRPSVNRKPRASRQQARARARSRSYHPSVERLEDRLAPANWNPIGPAPILHSVNTPGLDPVSGRISGLATDPTDANTIYIAAAGGGVWKTTNGGTTWTPLTDFQNPFGVHTLFMGSIAVAAGSDINHRTGTGEANFALDSFYGRGVLVSKDSGATWTLTGTSGPNNDSLFNRTAIGKVVIDPTDATGNTAYAAVSGFPTNGVKDHEGIWKTSDGGVHWTNTTATTVSPSGSNPFTDLVMDPHNHSVLFAAVGEPFSTPGLGAANGVYETTNGGASWSLTSFPSGSGTGRISLAIQDVGMMFTPTIYASVSDPTNTSHFGQLLEMEKSTDGGMTWNAVENESSANYLNYMGTAGFGMGWYNQTLAIDPADVNANTVYAGGSTNGGDSGFVKTTDGGMTWHDITVGSDGHGPHTDDHAVAFDHNGLLVDGNDGGVWRLDNPTVGMIHWTDLNGNLQITQFTGIAIHPTNLNIAFGGSQDNGTEKYTGSTAWNQVRGGDGGFVRIDPTNPIRVYGEFTGVSLFRSDDGGSTFSSKSAGIATHSGHVSFYVPYVLDPSNSNPVVLGTDFVNQTPFTLLRPAMTCLSRPTTAPAGRNEIRLGRVLYMVIRFRSAAAVTRTSRSTRATRPAKPPTSVRPRSPRTSKGPTSVIITSLRRPMQAAPGATSAAPYRTCPSGPSPSITPTAFSISAPTTACSSPPTASALTLSAPACQTYRWSACNTTPRSTCSRQAHTAAACSRLIRAWPSCPSPRPARPRSRPAPTSPTRSR